MIYGLKNGADFVGLTPRRFKEYIEAGKFSATKVKRGGILIYAFDPDTLLQELANWNY